jgi:hypothetical protein
MIQILQRPQGPSLSIDLDLDQAIARHGAWRVLRAALAALLRGPPGLRDAGRLSDHLRRDVGLPPGAVRQSPALRLPPRV